MHGTLSTCIHCRISGFNVLVLVDKVEHRNPNGGILFNSTKLNSMHIPHPQTLASRRFYSSLLFSYSNRARPVLASHDLSTC